MRPFFPALQGPGRAISRVCYDAGMRVSRALPILALVLLGISGCRDKPQAPAGPMGPQVSSAAAQEQALAAFQELGRELKRELEEALAQGGPGAAVAVCQQTAPEIAARISKERGFALGRSSHKLRNPANAPASEVDGYLRAHRDKPAAQAPVQVIEGTDQWTVVAPIPTQPLCLTCHGASDSLSPELKEALGRSYPKDTATGFQQGDLRGVFWARIPKQSLEQAFPGSLPLEGPSSRKIKTH